MIDLDVQLLPDGSMRFLEFKDPLVEGSIQTYRSRPDLQEDLAETLVQRAEVARALPNCTISTLIPCSA